MTLALLPGVVIPRNFGVGAVECSAESGTCTSNNRGRWDTTEGQGHDDSMTAQPVPGSLHTQGDSTEPAVKSQSHGMV